jgi:hypothetical protein
MRGEVKALALGIMAGIILLSIVVSMDFVYQAPRTAVAYVVNDNAANIALIPNDNHLKSPQGYFASINNGDLQINFGNVAPNSWEILSDVFYVENNLNQPVTVTITIYPENSMYNLTAYVNDPPSPPPPAMPPSPMASPPPPAMPPSPYTIQFTLGPGQEYPISLELYVGNVAPGTQIQFTMTVTATYNVQGGM